MPSSENGARKYSVGWVIAVYVEGVLLVLMTAIIVFGFVRMRQLNAKGKKLYLVVYYFSKKVNIAKSLVLFFFS